MKKTIVLAAMGIICASCAPDKNAHLPYPEAKKIDHVDEYFGVSVPDPYRWMENDTTAEVAAWVEEQNKVSSDYISKIPFRGKLRARLGELAGYERQGAPFKKNGKYYTYRNNGHQNQSVLYVQDTPEGPAKVLLDPNTLSDNGTVALTGVYFSNDGKYMAYTISRNGSDWTEIYVLDLASGKNTSDHIEWAKFTGASWLGDGFFYSAYPAPEEGKEFTDKNERHMIYYHKIGEPQSKDELYYENPQYPQRFYSLDVDENERFLFLYEDGAGNGNRLFFKDLKSSKKEFTEIASDFNYLYTVYGSTEDEFYVLTNNEAPMYRLMKGTAEKPCLKDWTTVIPESDNVLSSTAFIDGRIIATYSKDAADHSYVYSLDGERQYEIELPSLGSVGFTGSMKEPDCYYSFVSFTFPSNIYSLDLATGESKKFFSPDIDFVSEDYICEEVFFKSKDGTSIPMFLTYKKGLKKDGSNPAFLYGYGGFNISVPPSFSIYRIPFLESGGIYASVCLRGGSEYGEEWHLAGTQMNKQNVFDDCIAAAEYLISEGYSNPSMMCLSGASNGGLLVGAVINQRPDLFAVALPAVGVMDMLRYHKFTIGWNWAPDYGTSEDSPEMFEYLKGYSPLHTIKNDGTQYPAILVTTADHDDRVVPAHSFKYTATLQAADTGDRVKIIQIETDAGHGSGKPLSKTLEEQADSWAFTMWNLNMRYPR